jgi:peptide/nickel transport system permease protein
MRKNMKHSVKNFFSSLISDVRLVLGTSIFIAFVILGFILPYFSPYNPKRWGQVPRDVPPCWSYPLGTTSLGQDLFWLLTFALQNSLILGITVATISTLVGVILGLLAGYKGGYLDGIITFFSDVFIAIPSFPILVTLAALFLGRIHILMLAIVLCLFNWPWPAKQVRSMVLSLREKMFVDTAIFSGFGTIEIIFREIMPLISPWTFANFINTVLVAIGAEAGLATIGVSSLEEPTLGTMIYWALRYQAMFMGRWWWIAVPVGAIIILFIALFLIYISLSERFSIGGSKK